MLVRTPGGVWLSSILLVLAACGDDGSSSTSGAGGGGGTATSSGSQSSAATSGSSTSTSTSTGSATSSSQGSGGEATTASSGGGQGGDGAGGTSQGGGEQGGGEQGGGGNGSGAGGDGGSGAGQQGGGGDGGSSSSGSGGAGGSGGEGQGGAGGGLPEGTRVRIVTSNLTSGNFQSYDPGHGIRILQGIGPDIILVQEMTYGANNAAAMRSFADQICGDECDWARETFSGSGYLPNGVVSRYPIIDTGVWEDSHVSNREFFWARIDMPGPGDLIAVSVHLHTTVSSHADEGATLVEEITGERGIDDVVVLGGDFNTDDTTDLLFPELDDVFRVTEPWPVDQAANPNTNGGRTKRYDWVLADAGLDALEIPVVIGAQTFTTGLVVDTRVFTPLADIAPAQLNDSSPANSMQHMAVVRDFAFPD